MANMNKFSKGQIWFWKDPEAGDKKDAKAIRQGVGGYRYSRPVLIIQDSDYQCPKKSVVVIPFTTKDTFGGTILDSIYGNNKSYAVPYAPMTVQTSQLTEYITSVTPSRMKVYEAAIAQVLGIPLPDEYAKYMHQLEPAAEQEEKEIATKSENQTSSKSADIDEANPEPVTTPEKPVEESPVKEEETAVAEEVEAEDTSRKRNRRWSSDEKLAFVNYVDANGIDNAAKYYGYKISTVESQYHRFRRFLVAQGLIEKVDRRSKAYRTSVAAQTEESTTAMPDDTAEVNIPEMESNHEANFIKGISGISNLIAKHAINDKLDNFPQLYIDSNKKIEATRKGKKTISKNSFKTDFSTAVYYALLKYFEIEEFNGKLTNIPIFTQNSAQYRSAEFIEIYTKTNILVSDSPLNVMIKIRSTNPGVGLTDDFFPFLKNQLESKFLITDKAINRMVERVRLFIGEMFNLANIERSTSSIAEYIGSYCTEIDLWEQLKDEIISKKLVTKVMGYKTISSAAHHTLAEMFGFTKSRKYNKDGTYRLTYSANGLPKNYIQSLVFCDKFAAANYSNPHAKISTMLENYHGCFIEEEFTKIFKNFLKNSNTFSDSAIDIIANKVATAFITGGNKDDN